MSIITPSSLKLATIILRSRLTKPSAIGANILDPESALATNLDENFGRYIGYFSKRMNSEPCFVLLAKSDPRGSVDYLFVFYLRHCYSKVQQSELKQLKNKLPGLSKIPSEVSTSVINIQSDSPRSCDLSVLMQAVEFSIHPNLMTNFVSRHDIRTGKVGSFVCLNPDTYSPDCDLSKADSTSRKVCEFIKEQNLKIIQYNRKSIPEDFHILVAPYSGHLVYIINHFAIKSLMILLPHTNQFMCKEDSESFIRELKIKILPYRPRFIGATRYYGATACNGRDILKACVLSLALGNNLMTVIRQVDVDSVISEDKIDKAVLKMSKTVKESNSEVVDIEMIDEPQSIEPPASNSGVDDDVRVTEVRFDGDDGDTEILSIQTGSQSSQRTEIEVYDDIIDEYKRSESLTERLDSLIPPVPTLKPQTDMKGSILNDKVFFFDTLCTITNLWCQFTTVNLTEPKDLDLLSDAKFDLEDTGDCRFAIIPVIDEDLDINALMILDKDRREWVFISAENTASRDAEAFDEVERFAGNICESLKEMKRWPITLTSHFHRNYPKIHVLMGYFYLVKLFKYCNLLPSKLIYGEREIRQFTYEIGLQLQLRNLSYNIDNDLIRNNGTLKKGALRSVIPSLTYERSVVPKDQCPYCKKRGFTCLQRHIIMQHGGQSAHCNKIRHSNK